MWSVLVWLPFTGCRTRLLATGGDDAGAPTCAPDVPPRQRVTFHLHNASGADRFAVQDALGFCSPFAIDGLELGVPNVGCRQDVFGMLVIRLPPGDAFDLIWDGRHALPCQAVQDCTPWGGERSLIDWAWWQPVSSGRYRATFAVAATLPASCPPSTGNIVSCSTPPAGGPFLSLCIDSSLAVVDFALPATGQVDVDVPIH